MGTEIFNSFKTNFYSILNCLHCQQAHGSRQLADGKKKSKQLDKSQLASVKTNLNWYPSI